MTMRGDAMYDLSDLECELTGPLVVFVEAICMWRERERKSVRRAACLSGPPGVRVAADKAANALEASMGR